MNACIAVGRVDEAERLLERMHQQGFRVDARAYNLLLKGYARTGKIAKMRELLEEMQHRGVEPSTASYNTMISVHVRMQDMAEVRHFAQRKASLFLVLVIEILCDLVF
jgi:pentatricopeptide repeat protein